MFFKKDEKLQRNPEFSLASEAGRFFFIHRKSGQRVSTDSRGSAVWESLPGSVDSIVARVGSLMVGKGHEIMVGVSKDDALGPADLKRFLYVLHRAQLIDIEVNKIHNRGDGGGLENPRGESEDRAAAATADGSPDDRFVPPLDPGEDETLAEAPATLPLISAIIVTRNGEDHIRTCLASLTRQTYPNLEILVVDNGSTDRTRDIIRVEFPTVAVHASGKNLFYPGGVNFGMERARGDYFLVLNDDTEPAPSSVALLFRKMSRDERIAAVVPMMKLFHLRGFINGIGNHVRERSWGSDNFVGCVDIGQFSDLGEVPSACVSAVLIRKGAVADVGPLDAKYLAYYEDADWSFRAGLRGWKIVPEPGAIVYHKFSAYWKNIERKLKLAARNRLRFVLKLFQGRTERVYLKNYLKEDLKNVASFLKTKQFKMALAYLRAYASLASSLPDIFVKRRAAMKRKAPGASVERILRKNPENWSCLDAAGVPVIDVAVYRRYYRPEFERMDT